MTSTSFSRLDAAFKEIDNLLWFHTTVGGEAAGKRGKHFEALNKSAIVLICSCWEGYVESAIEESVARNIDQAKSPDKILKSISQIVFREIKKADDERTWHELCGSNWKAYAKKSINEKIAKLNTPKSENVKSLFKDILGVSDITDFWKWHKNDPKNVSQKINDIVELRGSIAHGSPLGYTLSKARVQTAYNDIFKVIQKTDEFLLAERFL